jgi:hypothetical protein
MEDEKIPQKKETPPPVKNDKTDLKQSSVIADESKKDVISSNEKNKDMEVHVRPQENKNLKIKLFLYEFFIIFLAVSLSFIVENIRERYIEHHQEVQYVNSLINDIKLDTLQLTMVMKANKNNIRGIDTLLRKLEIPNSQKIVNHLYYYSFRYLNSLDNFTHTDRTISQLKNAGGLRLIQSKAASDSIIAYYGSVQNVELNGDYCFKVFYDLSKQQKELFDFKIIRTGVIHHLLTNSSLKLLSNDPRKIDLYYNEVLYYGGTLNSYRNTTQMLKKQATNLLETLKKEYNIK